MSTLLEPATVDALGRTLLHFLWQGLLVGALLELVLVALRDASSDARYLVRCGALALMAALPCATFALLREPQAAGVAGVAGAVADAVRGAPGAVLAEPSTLLSALVLAWAVGASLLCLRTAGGWLRLRLLCSGATGRLPDRWQATFGRLARELRVRATAIVVDSSAMAVPTVIGWLKPVVLVPARVLTGLSDEQIEVLLAHELAHVRRADYLVNLLQSLVEALLFFHPVVWRVSSGIRTEREFCCDDAALAVTGNGMSFARALTELESWRGEQAQLAVSTLGGSLMHRIQRMVGIQTSTPRRGARIGQAVAVLVAAGSLGAVAFGFTARDAHEVHVHEGCQRCEKEARRVHEHLAGREELERHLARAEAQLADLRAQLADLEAQRADVLYELQDGEGYTLGEVIVEVAPESEQHVLREYEAARERERALHREHRHREHEHAEHEHAKHEHAEHQHAEHRRDRERSQRIHGGHGELIEVHAETDSGEIVELLLERHGCCEGGDGPLVEERLGGELVERRERQEDERARHIELMRELERREARERAAVELETLRRHEAMLERDRELERKAAAERAAVEREAKRRYEEDRARALELQRAAEELRARDVEAELLRALELKRAAEAEQAAGARELRELELERRELERALEREREHRHEPGREHEHESSGPLVEELHRAQAQERHRAAIERDALRRARHEEQKARAEAQKRAAERARAERTHKLYDEALERYRETAPAPAHEHEHEHEHGAAHDPHDAGTECTDEPLTTGEAVPAGARILARLKEALEAI